MKILDNVAVSFDDVLLVPQHSELSSRDEVDLSSIFENITMRLPVFASPMDTVTNTCMQKAMVDSGCLGIHHRYCKPAQLLEAAIYGPIAVAPSLGVDFLKQLKDEDNLGIIFLDVAHGDSKPCLDYAEEAVKLGLTVVSGNIATPGGAHRYSNVGVNILRVGIGGGSACSTRIVAGCGVPTLQSIMDISEARYGSTILIADGGIRNSGDIVKVLAAGADFVILGRLLAAANEAPGERWAHSVVDPTKGLKDFRGMASEEALDAAGKERNVEGVSTWIEEEGPVAGILDKLERGMRAGFAYLGARNIKELRNRAHFIRVSHNGYIEGLPKT